MDFNQVKELICMIDTSSFTEFNIDFENTRMTMNKTAAATENNNNRLSSVPTPQSSKVSNSISITNVPEESSGTEPITILPKAKIIEKEGNIITSPLVGTFYEASSPDKPPFVTVGSIVKQGDILGIVEAMKVMNEITSKFDGKIAEILVDNEAMVEYGQELFRIV